MLLLLQHSSAMNYENILVDVADGVAVITLNRPEVTGRG
jgi:1,4-dihydroxy-2-naphthoyl-CoA synthase